MNTSTLHPSIAPPKNHGVVYKKSTNRYTVRFGTRVLECGLANRLHQAGSDPVAVGDYVRVSEPSGSQPFIEAVLPRLNQFSRRSAVPRPGSYASEQVIAANIDQVVPVFAAASPEPHWNLLDRYLVSAEAHGLSALIVITKLDLIESEDSPVAGSLSQAVTAYRAIGYPVLLVSAQTGAGLETLKQALAGKLSVLLGKSGVGKTSLLNALQDGLGLRVNEISRANGKGKHTTSHMEMFPLDWGGAIIDTPGVREFGLWDIDAEELAYFFPEMHPFIGRCKYGASCSHDDEPGCAIRKGVMAGHIDPRRYQSYLRMKADAFSGDR